MTNRELDQARNDAASVAATVNDLAHRVSVLQEDLDDLRGEVQIALDAFDIADANTDTDTAEEALNRMRDAMKELRRCLH